MYFHCTNQVYNIYCITVCTYVLIYDEKQFLFCNLKMGLLNIKKKKVCVNE